MLTREQILKNLKEDPLWEPDEDATNEEWELYEEVYEEFDNEQSGDKKEKTPDIDEDELDYLDDDDDEDGDSDDEDLSDFYYDGEE